MPANRRVLQIDYAAEDLPAGLGSYVWSTLYPFADIQLGLFAARTPCNDRAQTLNSWRTDTAIALFNEGAVMTSMMPSAMPLPPIARLAGEQPTVLLFGDSHSHAVHLAVENRLARGLAAPLAVFRQIKEKNGREVGNISFDGFLKRISQLRRNDLVLSAMGGSRHAVYGTTQHPQPFDFFMPGSGFGVAADSEIIPFRALQKLFAEGIYERVGRRLNKMRSATEARVVHLIPPPPKGDNQYVARHHEKSYAREGIATLGVSPPELRLKFWQLQARVLQKLCSKLRVEVMMPPTFATKDGFLRLECSAEDTTHANELYGELVIRSVEAQFLPEKPSLPERSD